MLYDEGRPSGGPYHLPGGIVAPPVFVSRHAGHTINLEPEEVEWSVGPNGKRMKHVIKQPLAIQFKNDWWLLDDYQRAFALQAFYEGKYRQYNEETEQWEPIPVFVRNAGLASEASELRMTEDGVAEYTVGDRREHHLGVWYPSDIADEEERARIIDLLLAIPEHGLSFIFIEPQKLPAPWPTYDKMTSIKNIVKFALDGGYDFKMLAAYEESNENRQELLQAFVDAHNGLIEKANEDATLSTTA